jgi:predicted kinase
MRKWMRERLQRRKKTPAEPVDQASPPPLQPAYFDVVQGSENAPDSEKGAAEDSTAPPSITEDQALRSARSSSEKQPSEAPSSEAIPAGSQPVAGGPGGAGRSRRRRGGRGRGGRGREQALAQAFAPAALKGSVPVPPAESGEEELPDTGEADGQAAGRGPAESNIPAAPQRPAKGVVVLAIGLPGSGKTSWFKRHNVVPLSSDMVRSLLFDDVREQRFQDLVFSNLRSMLKARLIAKRPMNYVDATNLTPQERQHWIKLARDYQYEVQAVFFDVPLEVCLDRDQRRDRVVPEEVMRRMAAKLKPPAFEEGFSKITVVRVKKKEPEA